MYKLSMYGIEGKLYSCINSFLSNRTQRVIVGNVSSDIRQLVIKVLFIQVSPLSVVVCMLTFFLL